MLNIITFIYFLIGRYHIPRYSAHPSVQSHNLNAGMVEQWLEFWSAVRFSALSPQREPQRVTQNADERRVSYNNSSATPLYGCSARAWSGGRSFRIVLLPSLPIIRNQRYRLWFRLIVIACLNGEWWQRLETWAENGIIVAHWIAISNGARTVSLFLLVSSTKPIFTWGFCHKACGSFFSSGSISNNDVHSLLWYWWRCWIEHKCRSQHSSQ